MTNLFRQQCRKYTALILVGILLILSLTGCKKDDPTGETTLPPETTEAASIPSTAAPTEAPEPLLTGVVTAEQLNVREGPGVDYDKVTKLVKGDTVEVWEKQDVEGVMWGRIDDGWICLAYVQEDGTDDPRGDTMPDPEDYLSVNPITGSVISTELNVRSGPGTNYKVVGTLKFGEEVTISELDGNWGKTEDGWVNTLFVYFKDSIDSISVNAVVTTNGLNVRSGPGTGYESLKKLNADTEVTIYKQALVKDVWWGYIGDGWICMDYVKISGVS